MKPVRTITVRRAPGRNPSSGVLLAGGKAFPCLLGKNGITVNKREGDWKTPAGSFRLLFALYRKDRINPPTSRLPTDYISEKAGWCDAPDNPNYNRPVKLPVAASHERLKRDDGLYDIVVVMDHNYTRRVRGRGSAVFFHLTAEKKHTAGCVAIARDDMLRLLPLLSNTTVMRILP